MFYKYEEWVNIILWALVVVGLVCVLLVTVNTDSDTGIETVSATEQTKINSMLNPISGSTSGLYYDSDTEVVYLLADNTNTPVVYYAYNGNIMHYCPHDDSYYTLTPEGDKVSNDLFAHST